MIFGINTTRDISKLSQISLAELRITVLKYHLWYLYQISLQIMLLPIQIQLKSCSEFCYNVLLPDIFKKYYKPLTVVVHEYILWTSQSLVNL